MALKRKKKDYKSLKILGLLMFICTIVCVGLLFVLSFLLNKLKFSLPHVKATLIGNLYWKVVLLAFGGVFFFWISRQFPKLFKKKLKDFNEGEDAKIIYPEDLKKNDLYISTTYDKLNTVEDANLLQAEYVHGKLRVLLNKEPTHSLVIGETGSGKSTAFIDPIVQCLAQTKTLPSMVITDPKGELFNKHSAVLKKQGYNISVFNLADPYKSTRWNPFQNLILQVNQLIELDKKPKNDSDTRLEIAQIEDDLYENAKDVIYTMCPITNKNDPNWQTNARDFILGFLLAMCEDARSGKIKTEQINLFNMHFNLTRYSTAESYQALVSYFKGRDPFSKAVVQVQSVLSSVKSEKTFACYLSEIQTYLSWVHDRGIQTLTAQSELSFDKFDEQPNVLFLQLPDERKTRHTLASILILQCYKALVSKARQNEGTYYGDTYIDSSRLLRHVYFLLDEFGNMPKFEDINSMISVARSRGIFFTFILQSLEQLGAVYGTDTAKIVKDNCAMKVFLGTSSTATMDEFIKLGGQTKATSVSTSKSGDSESVHAVNLITITDLKTLNTKKDFGNALISTFGQSMLLSKYTPSFKVSKYIFGTCSPSENTAFDIVSLHFDITDLLGEGEIRANFKLTKGSFGAGKEFGMETLEVMESKLVTLLDAEQLEHYHSCNVYEKIEFCKMKTQSASSRSEKRFFSELVRELKYEKEKNE